MRLRNISRKMLIALLWLAAWAAAAAVVDKTLLLPSPRDTLRALIGLLPTGTLWRAVAASLTRVMIGFCSGLALGALLAFVMHASKWAHALFSPMLSAVAATPVASFILLALVWIRLTGVPAFATALIVLPLSAANLSAGIRAADPQLLEMAAAFGMSRGKQLAHIYWPSLRPFLRAAVMSGIGMAWKAGVAAEVIVTPKNALGTLLYRSKVYLDMPALFAATAVVIALSVALEKALNRLTRGGRAHD